MFFLRKISNFLKISFIIILISFILSLFIDFFFGKSILNKLDPYLSQTDFYERLIRIDHKFYHHTLKKNIEYKKAAGFGGIIYFVQIIMVSNISVIQKEGKFKIAFLGLFCRRCSIKL